MGFGDPRILFQKALKERFAIGAFNFTNLETLQGIIAAAREEKSPVILQVTGGAWNYAGHNYVLKMVEAAALENDIPVVLHYDHGESFEACKKAIDSGFQSVMIDGSHLPFEENVALTKRVVDYAHEKGVFVEAELGKISGTEEHVYSGENVFTDPDQAVEFVERTGCDALAVSVGTSHGVYKYSGDPVFDMERLKRIHNALPETPLVLHGASSIPVDYVEMANQYGAKLENPKGIPEDILAESVNWGVTKINIETDLRIAFVGTLRKFLHHNPAELDLKKLFGLARDAVKEVVKYKIHNILKSCCKA